MTRPVHRFRHDCMGGWAELAVAGDEAAYAAGAARAVFDLFDRLERLLSRYLPDSCIGRINAAPAGVAVPVSTDALRCLVIARQMWQASGGAFDPTILPLLRLWQDEAGRPRRPEPEAVEAAAARCGMEHLRIDEAAFTVTCAVEGLQVDTGGIGKGYAVDAAMDLLADWDLDNVLVHMGRSSIRARGEGPDGGGWPVGVGPGAAWGRLHLRGSSLAASGVENRGGHVIDPVALRPASRTGVWVHGPQAVRTDALGTALLCMEADAIERLLASWPAYAAAWPDDEARPRTLGRFPVDA